ncbi:MAG TPA: SIS domain-containing protein [Burkholderiaceae bacterium]|nr:SIS domain-containing protein [Burkholderiaceae bacterium]
MLDRLRQQIPSLSAAERKAAEFVLQHPGDAAKSAVGDIARRAGVSEPTVIRFCRSLGCRGWPDFKVRLTASLMSGIPYVHSSLSSGESTAALAGKVFDNAVSALLRARNDLDPERVDEAVALLARARRIEFHGLGNSGIVAADAQHKFFRYDLCTVAYSDPHIQMMAASMLGPRDVLVAISHSGRSKDLLDAVATARRNDCPVIAITASNTPLAQSADVLLRADTQEDTELYSPMLSRLVHLVIVDLLALSVAMALGKDVSRVLERTKKSLKGKRTP